MLSVLHAVGALGAAAALVRSLHQPFVRDNVGETAPLFGLVVVLPIASALASLLAIVLARRTGTVRATAALDLASAFAALAVAVFVSLGPVSKSLLGLFVVGVLVLRLAPSLWLLLTLRERHPLAAAALALLWYATLALWSGAVTAAQGDQAHYLLTADRLVAGSLDVAPIYAEQRERFERLADVPLSDQDVYSHAVVTPNGTRLVQGYGLAALLAPGWAVAERTGALLVLALVGAFAAWHAWSLALESVGPHRRAAVAWALAALAAPVAIFATVVYPNIVGAALLVAAYRWLFTAPRRRPLGAGVLAALTLFLTPRDGIAAFLLVPFALLAGRDSGLRYSAALGGGVVAAALANALIFGLPLPYAGYAFGIDAVQRAENLPTLSFRVDTALPGLLFDRAWGLAAGGAWAFIGVAGIAPALRARGRELGPALAVVIGSVLALSIYRLWEGGWAPPSRYLVDVLPLWLPFVGYGIAVLEGVLLRAALVVLIALSALATFLFAAVPEIAYNPPGGARLVATLDALLPLNPLRLLPTFQVSEPAEIARAWLRALPLVAGIALFAWAGAIGRVPAALAPRVSRRAALVLFVEVNALLLAAMLVVYRPVEPGGGGVVESVLLRWLPFALALATVLTAALAVGAARPGALFARHAAMWVSVAVLGALARFGFPDESLFGFGYVALVFAIAAHGVAALWEGLDRRSDRATGLLLGLTVLTSALALLPYERAVAPTASDEPHYLLTMRSLVQERDFNVRDEYDELDYLDFYPEPLPDRHAIDVGSSQYPIRDPGLPLLGALPFAVAGRDGVLALMCAVGAVFAWRAYALLRLLGFSARVALLAAALVALTHPVFTYTTQVYPELVGALAVLVVAELLARPSSVARFAAASALVGLLPVLSARFWFPAIGLGIVLGWLAARALLARRPRENAAVVLAAALPFLAFVGGYVAYDWLHFRLPIPNAGYYVIAGQQTVLAWTPHVGMPGIFLDRTFGLLARAPVYALAFVGVVPLLRQAWRERSAPIAALGLAWGLSFLYIGNIQYWWADGSPASRYQVATIPFLLCCVAAGLARVRGLVPTLLVAVAAIWSVGVTAIFAAAPGLRYDLAVDVQPTGGPGQLWAFVSRITRFDPGLLFPSAVRYAPEDVALTVGWIVALGGLLVIGTRAGAGRSSRRVPPPAS